MQKFPVSPAAEKTINRQLFQLLISYLEKNVDSANSHQSK